MSRPWMFWESKGIAAWCAFVLAVEWISASVIQHAHLSDTETNVAVTIRMVFGIFGVYVIFSAVRAMYFREGADARDDEHD